MKVTIKNLGPVADASVELGNLTVVCGPNNSGKTHFSYAVYCFHKFCQETAVGSFTSTENHPLISASLVKDLVENGETSVTVDLDRYMEYYPVLTNRLVKSFNGILHEWFAMRQDELEDCQVDFSFDIEAMKRTVAERLATIRNMELVGTTVDFREGKLFFDGNSRIQRYQGDAEQRQLVDRFARRLDTHILQPNLRRPFIISAERMGISVFHKDLDITRISLAGTSRNPDMSNQPNPYRNGLLEKPARHARPIRDEIEFVRNLPEIVQQKSEVFDDPDKKFHKRIEELMNAKFVLVEDEVHIASSEEAKFKFLVPINQASTSTRELSHLYFYLKHVARKNDLLVLDEPESHLSTPNQISLVRILSDCVNEGISILLSTHSEIILNELNNMIKLGQLAKTRQDVVKEREHYARHQGMLPQDVHAYYCENGTLTNCSLYQWGMNFRQVNDTLFALDEDSAFLGEQVSRLKHE